MNETIGELLPPTRVMLTPGPSNMDARVYRALSTPLVGHMDPWFIEMMGDVQGLLRRVFQVGSSRVDLQACKLEYSIV